MPNDSIVFDRAAEYYDQTRGFPPGEEAAIGALIAEAGSLTPSSRVLEIGVGTGRIALPVSLHAGHTIGVDLSRLMMGRLRAKQSGEPVHLVQADATRLPFAPHSFDAAICVHVFHLIPDYLDAVAELIRSLKPGAPLILGHNSRDQGWEPFKPMVDAWDQAVPPEQQKKVGVAADEEEVFLLKLGWRKVEPRRTHPFVVRLSPRQYFERYQGRTGSNMWRIADDDYARALESLRRVMEETYPNPDQAIETPTSFNVDIFLPPVEG